MHMAAVAAAWVAWAVWTCKSLSAGFVPALKSGLQVPKPRSLQRLRGFFFGGCWIDGAEISEIAAVRQHDGHRDVTFDLVEFYRVMIAVLGMGAGVIDDDGRPGFHGFETERGVDVQLAARRQSKMDVVLDQARGPAVFGDAGDRRKSHSRGFAQDFQQGGYRFNLTDGQNVASICMRANLTFVRPDTIACPQEIGCGR
jgi:hypothetical protein